LCTCILEASFRRVLLGTICGFDKARARDDLVFNVTRMGFVGWMDMAISGECLLYL
jgi:hypothetical protein